MCPRDAANQPVPGPCLDGLEPLLTWLPEGGISPDGGWDAVCLEGHLLRRQARTAVGKGRGTDGWSAEPLFLLPEDFWDRLAAIWNSFLQGSPLP